MSRQAFTVHSFNKACNFFLVETGQDLTLIDAGGKDKIDNIRSKFAQTGHRLEDVKRIVLTHCHIDHVGCLAALKQATGAEVLAHEAEAPFISGAQRLPQPWGKVALFLHIFTAPLFQPEPCEVDRTLKDGEIIEGTGLKVVHMPGHSPGSICLYHPGERVLFSGDAAVNLFNRVGPVPPFCTNVRQARRSLGRLTELDVETIYFAHGDPINKGANELIRLISERDSFLDLRKISLGT